MAFPVARWSFTSRGSGRRVSLTLHLVHRTGRGRLARYEHAHSGDRGPAETVWSNLKRSVANLTKQGLDQLVMVVKTRLKRMQYRPGLIYGFPARTGPRPHAPVTFTIEDL